jgi:hypothetical protein
MRATSQGIVNPGEALADLYDLPVHGLRAALGGYGRGVEANVEDFVQEALIKITGNLDSFRGESREGRVAVFEGFWTAMVERDLRRRYAREYRVLRADPGEQALDTSRI